MSNYLITLKLNDLQSQVNTLAAVDGLTNPLVADTPLDANANNIENVGILTAAEVSTQSVESSTGDFSTSLRATSIIQYTGGFNQVSISGGGVSCLTVNTNNIAAGSSQPIQIQSSATCQQGVTIPNVNLPLNIANPSIPSDFLILKANTNSAIGPTVPCFGYVGGTNPNPTLPLYYSCLNDNTVNPALATVSVTKSITISGEYSQFPYYNITGSSYYWFPIWSWTVPEGISFSNITATISSISLSTAGGIGTILPFSRTFYLQAGLTNSLSALYNDFELGTSQFTNIVYPSNVTSYTRVLTQQYLVSQYNKPQRGNKVYLALMWDEGYPLPNPIVPIIFSWSEITLNSIEFTLSNSRLTSDPESTDGGGGVVP